MRFQSIGVIFRKKNSVKVLEDLFLVIAVNYCFLSAIL